MSAGMKIINGLLAGGILIGIIAIILKKAKILSFKRRFNNQENKKEQLLSRFNLKPKGNMIVSTKQKMGEEEYTTEEEEYIMDKEAELAEQQDFMDDMKEEQLEDSMLPEQERLLDKYLFLNNVKESDNTIKTSYLTKTELGKPLFPVRFWMELATYAELKGYHIVKEYCISKAKNITDTGLSNEGFLLGLVVTKRRETAVKRKSPVSELQQKENKNIKY